MERIEIHFHAYFYNDEVLCQFYVFNEKLGTWDWDEDKLSVMEALADTH